MSRGKFIVFEGLDRSGKSTQCKMLNNYLFNSKLISFPDRNTEIGKMISSYLSNDIEINNQTIHLLFAANRWEKASFISSSIEAGIDVIADRYSYSGISYSASKGLNFEWCKQSEIGLPIPDIVFYIEINPHILSMRNDYGIERFENINFQIKVKNNFNLLKSENWHVIDGTKSISSIFDEVKEKIDHLKLN